MLHKRMLAIAKREARVSILEVGEGPYSLPNGGTVALRDQNGNFMGNCVRHVWYAIGLAAGRSRSYDNVMIADGSDVFFQRNPFSLSRQYATYSLLFFGDRGDSASKARSYFRRCMGQCGDPRLNSEPLLDRIHRQFSGVYANGGLLLGKTQAMYNLSLLVVATASRCNFWTSDQGLVNYARFLAMTRDSASVFTFPDMTKSVSMGRYEVPHRNRADQLVRVLPNGEKEPYHILHQYYTGNPKRLKRFYGLVRQWVERGSWPQSGAGSK